MLKVLALVALVVLAAGCVGNTVTFKECKFDYTKIREDQVAKLWVEIENNGDFSRDLQVVFIHPQTITIESKGKPVRGFNVTVEPKGATSGRRYFNVYGDYVEGQPSSPWEVEVRIYSDNELVEGKKLTLTILPPE